MKIKTDEWLRGRGGFENKGRKRIKQRIPKSLLTLERPFR